MTTETETSSNTILVAAIDFGTTYSGYAFSFRNTPLYIQTPQTWYAGSTQLASLKTPTCLLIRAGKKTQFGYEAENLYAELTTNGDYNADKSYFFQHFKMLLHGNKNLSKSTMVDDINGKSMQALKVFSLSIEYFKNHLLETIRTRTESVNLGDVHFVITVPTIWNDLAKQFMREAAVLFVLDNDKLTIALEPEAASIYCQNLLTDKLASSCKFEVTKDGTENMVVDLGGGTVDITVHRKEVDGSLSSLHPATEGTSCKFEVAKAGTEYMVVDLGGGTVDITVHRKEVDGSLSSLHAATGGPWGGQMVNQEYINLITEIVSKEVMQKFQLEEMGDYFELLRDFETKKRTASGIKEGHFFLRIPVSLIEIYENAIYNSYEGVQRSRYNQHISFKRDKLKVNSFLITEMFKKSIDETINHVSNLLDEPKMRNVDRILLVGGYSECPLILEAFRNRFCEKRIINPHQAGIAVINGAVHFGHNPAVISSRILSYTYGTNIAPKFQEGNNPEHLKYIDEDGTCRCNNVFDVFKCSGGFAKLGEKVTKIYNPTIKSQTRLATSVYSTQDPNPKYVTSEDCTYLGEVTVNLPPYEGKNRSVTVDFVFGLTEFMIEATDDTNGEKDRKYFNLLEKP